MINDFNMKPLSFDGDKMKNSLPANEFPIDL